MRVVYGKAGVSSIVYSCALENLPHMSKYCMTSQYSLGIVSGTFLNLQIKMIWNTTQNHFDLDEMY